MFFKPVINYKIIKKSILFLVQSIYFLYFLNLSNSKVNRVKIENIILIHAETLTFYELTHIIICAVLDQQIIIKSYMKMRLQCSGVVILRNINEDPKLIYSILQLQYTIDIVNSRYTNSTGFIINRKRIFIVKT